MREPALNTYSVLTISGFKPPRKCTRFLLLPEGFEAVFLWLSNDDNDQVNVIKAQFSFTHFNYSHSGCNQLLLSNKALI